MEITIFRKVTEKIDPKINFYWEIDAEIQRDTESIVFSGGGNGRNCDTIFVEGGGAFFDYKSLIEDRTYLITCIVKAIDNYGSQFQIWCHDNPEERNNALLGTKSNPIIPSKSGSQVNLVFHAHRNTNLRVHLHYLSGEKPTKIEVSNVKIIEIQTV